MTVLDERLREQAALQLLASSSARRYVREATRIARASGLAERARDDAATRAKIWERIVELVEATREAPQRGLEEIEAAVLACVVAKNEGHAGIRRLDDLLGPRAAVWLRALVDRLVALAPAAPEEIEAALEPVRRRAGQLVTIARPAAEECEERAA
jgi:hypothetical protein